MQPRGKILGVSLVEVVIAVGVFGIAVGAVLGVLPILTRTASDSDEALVAEGLPDAVRVALTLSSSSLDALASAIPVMAAPLERGFSLAASRGGERVNVLRSAAPGGSATAGVGDAFFLIEVWRFNTPPLAYTNTGAVLPLYVRVSWPYRIGAESTSSELAVRTQFTFTLALSR